jgi:hypothetical protein
MDVFQIIHALNVNKNDFHEYYAERIDSENPATVLRSFKKVHKKNKFFLVIKKG